MNQPFVLSFEDFKSLTSNHRIYYFEGDNFFDFHFLVDGQIIKATILKQDIESMKRFFSDKMFYGAIRILFNIPIKQENIFSILDKEKKVDLIDLFQDEETKNTDIQPEGTEE